MDRVKFNAFSEILDEDFNRQSTYVNDAVSLFIQDFLTANKTAILGLEVKAQAISDMTVYVAPGRLYQVGQQGEIKTNSNPPLMITAAHPNYDRIDRVCARYAEIDDEPETRNVMVDTVSRQVIPKTVMTRTAGTIEFMIVNGTAAPVPAPPTAPTGWISLAQISIKKNVTNILQTDILDERPTVSAYLAHKHTGGGDGAKISYKDINGAPDVSNMGLNLLKRNKRYEVGDIAYSANLPSWARLECAIEGTTAVNEPSWGTTAGVLIVDGTVTWIIDDVRDCTPTGRIVYDNFLRTGNVKANGATVNRADYPRLVKLATDNSLFYDDKIFTGTTTSSSATISGISTTDIAKLKVGMSITGTGITTGTTITEISTTSITISLVAMASGTVTISYGNATNYPGLYGKGDGSTTFVLPNGIDLIIQGGIDAGAMIKAGLPNITGNLYGNINEGGVDGAFYIAARSNSKIVATGQSDNWYTNIVLNASRSSNIYGASTTVQPPALTMIPQIKY